MLRILFYLALVFAIGLGFAWLADHPGNLVVTLSGYQYQVTLMVAAIIVMSLIVLTMVTWWLLKSIWYSPYTISRYFRVRRRDRGYQALSTGMIAAGAGDAGLARKKKKEAMKLISADQEPLIHLLDAQASLLEGDHEAARGKFEAMLSDPEMRLLGLRGLYLEAERLGDRAAARHYAAKATLVAPQLGWAAEASLEEKGEAGEWDEAIRIVETQKSTRQIERDVAQRRRAVLLTAKANDLLDSDPASAKSAGLEAHKLAPGFVPAALVAARAAFRLGDIRKGSKILEAAWKQEPHPEVADVYVHARGGDSTHDRLERAKRLQSLRRNHVESALVVARAALDAGEFALARQEADAAARMEAREGVFLLLADIEEAETGDQGKIRYWLGRAVRAARDPAWVADGIVSEHWQPVSPSSGRLDAFEWRVPSEKLGQLIEQDENTGFKMPVAPVISSTAPQTEAITGVDIETSETPKEVVIQPSTSVSAKAGEKKTSADIAGPAMVVQLPVLDAEPAPDSDDEHAHSKLARLPDDPGVEPENKQEEKGSFRLF